MNATLPAAADPLKSSPSYRNAVREACRRIPPLWPLKHFVAVNPFVGLADRPFAGAAALMRRVGHGEMLMPAAYYLEQIDGGRIRETDVAAALRVAGPMLPPAWMEWIPGSSLADLKQALESLAPPDGPRVLTFADHLDARRGTGWATFVVEEMSKWCSVYFDEGQSSWRMPWRQLGLFAAWKAAARVDANPELAGLAGFRAFVGALPDDPWKCIDQALEGLGVPAARQADFLHRQMMTIPGWSGHVQYLAREKDLMGGPNDPLAQLLAIRLAHDLALRQQFGGDAALARAWEQQVAAEVHAAPGDLPARLLAQQALECAYQRELLARLAARPASPARTGRCSLQAVFCIDVRSEVYRRALEAQSGRIETIGFAGFFGLAVEFLEFGKAEGGAHCPVLLRPRFKIREAAREARAEAPLLRRMNLRQAIHGAANAFRTSAISCFSFVETAGLWSGAKLIQDGLALAPAESDRHARSGRLGFGPKIDSEACCPDQHGHDQPTGIPLPDQIALAAGALKHMGLVRNFAEVVLICGHGSATTNNPYGSALDCGACGGHAGDINARVAAAILNEPAVRRGLQAEGISIPDDTLFVAALHNTTTDDVRIFEDAPRSASHSAALENVRRWLDAASREARRERASALGLGEVAGPGLDSSVLARSRDWSQVRPEWGLAGNAAFIAAPRERTKGLNLGGRAFLHNYQADLDRDRATLELILVAPMVVASWINLQYYGSTVDNRLFGSGNKVLHNVVGTFGVWQGNGGDLQPGLPLQSIHDGLCWRHEPLRLSVFIEAPREEIAAILARHSGVRELVANGWVQLFALENEGREIHRFVGDQFVPEPV